MADAGFYKLPAAEQTTAQTRYAVIEDELLVALTRWEELDARVKAA
jgi:hypothetical protein